MKRRSFAKRRDANEGDIVMALEGAGCSVVRLDIFDLLVGYKGVTTLMEVKDPDSPNGMNRRKSGELELTEKQREFIDTWRGSPLEVVTTAEQAVAVVMGGEA